MKLSKLGQPTGETDILPVAGEWSEHPALPASTAPGGSCGVRLPVGSCKPRIPAHLSTGTRLAPMNPGSQPGPVPGLLSQTQAPNPPQHHVSSMKPGAQPSSKPALADPDTGLTPGSQHLAGSVEPGSRLDHKDSGTKPAHLLTQAPELPAQGLHQQGQPQTPPDGSPGMSH